MKTIPKRFYSAKEVCSILGIHRTTFYTWVNQGTIKAFMVGNRLKVSSDDLAAFLKEAEIELED